MLCDFGNQSILLRAVDRDAPESTDDITQRIPKYGVLDQERGFHPRRPNKRDSEEKIDVRTVRHERDDGLTTIWELALNAPTENAENRPANLSSQEVSAFRQIITQHLPLHCASSLLKTLSQRLL